MKPYVNSPCVESKINSDIRVFFLSFDPGSRAHDVAMRNYNKKKKRLLIVLGPANRRDGRVPLSLNTLYTMFVLCHVQNIRHVCKYTPEMTF